MTDIGNMDELAVTLDQREAQLLEAVLDGCHDQTTRDVAQLRLEGWQRPEIMRELGLSRREYHRIMADLVVLFKLAYKRFYLRIGI